MFMYFLAAAVMFFALVGLSDVIAGLWRWLNGPKRKRAGYIIVPVSGHNSQIESDLRRVRTELSWGRLDAAGFAVVNMGADAETTEICRGFCRQYGASFLEGEATVEGWLSQSQT